MKTATILALVVALACEANGLFKLKPRRKLENEDQGVTLCPATPLPVASASEVLSKLQPFLDEAEEKINATLVDDKSPGGVAINVVYNDTVIWSRGFGLINESGSNLVK